MKKEHKTKQVIIVRMKYPDGNGGVRKIRTGKIAAQVAHASLAVFTNRLDYYCHISNSTEEYKRFYWDSNKEAEYDWLKNGFAKIVVGVDTEEELVKYYEQAKKAGLLCSLITDSGDTEFKGIPTKTTCAIGPDYDYIINPITGHLKLI